MTPTTHTHAQVKASQQTSAALPLSNLNSSAGGSVKLADRDLDKLIGGVLRKFKRYARGKAKRQPSNRPYVPQA